MSSNSICFAGLSREEEAEITAMFRTANSRVGSPWQMAPETDAGTLVIDMDSMYGQMSLMKALGTGKTLVALTASGRADTDYVLRRPVTVEALAELLEAVGSGTPAPAPAANPTPEPAPAAPAPAELLDWPDETERAPAARAAGSSSPEPAAVEAESPAPAGGLAGLLRPGVLTGPVRLQVTGAPDLVLDPQDQTYLGGSALKPLIPYCGATLDPQDLQSVRREDLAGIAAALGSPQPWSRLAWLCALSCGNGALAAGHGINDRFKLLRWPQTEREFPKHFRIATVMMKGPANLSEIAEQSGASLGEVVDFVNACLATGVVEPDAPAPAAADGTRTGLLGRFRR